MGANPTQPRKRLGAWLARANNTVYQAATDGFVLATGIVGDSTVLGLTDAATPPTSLRRQEGQTGVYKRGVTFPVKKNHYWKVEQADIAVWWIPLEP